MIVTQTGKYKLLNDIKTRNSISIGTLQKGTVIEITQVDIVYHKVNGSPLLDWTYWDLPVEKETLSEPMAGGKKYLEEGRA